MLAVLVVVANVLAARHARAFLVYADSAETVPQPEQLTRWQKIRLLVNGVAVPRPKNTTTPESLQIPFTTHRVEIESGWLELWHLPRVSETSSGVVLMFPGYSAAKSSLLPEAVFIRSLGFDIVMVDFRGAGGSSGSDNTLGIREAEDVAATVKFARERWPERRIVLFGRSMGAAAILRAVAHLEVKADAVILESPFDRMLNTVRNRFRSMGLPTFPGSEMLVFWGGWRLGFDGFSHNPEEYAERVTLPTLVMSGAEDVRATPEQVRAIFDRLRGAKRLAMFDGVGHEALKKRQPEVWGSEVNVFLQSINP